MLRLEVLKESGVSKMATKTLPRIGAGKELKQESHAD
jgi:hypothetical protein